MTGQGARGADGRIGASRMSRKVGWRVGAGSREGGNESEEGKGLGERRSEISPSWHSGHCSGVLELKDFREAELKGLKGRAGQSGADAGD